ncbi:MAG: prepilin-type N-terminal cleavage/methylation domain-containing protein [Eubacterium sp.]|nr:prepilin-type N-terminal cleavage/methylation domain-containing protein [Eubacterium sp.]
MRKKKRSLKGTTLVEIIVALAVFAMLGLILAQLGMAIDKTNKASSRLNKRVNIQAPYAASQQTEYDGYTVDEDGNKTPATLTLDNSASQIEVSIKDDTGATKSISVNVRKAAGSDEMVTQSIPAEVTISGRMYNTKPLVVDNPNVYDADSANKNHHLQFIVLDAGSVDLSPITFDYTDPTKAPDDVDAKKQSIYALPDGISWESTDTNVATVNGAGVVKAVNAQNGNCTIIGTVIATGVQYLCEVTVVGPSTP